MFMKYFAIVICLIVITSCSEKNNRIDKCKEFETSYSFIKEYLENRDEKSFLLSEIEKNIETLESITGIKSSKGGNTIGKFWVQDIDIKLWKEWRDVNCISNTTKQ